jgi:hypothetical protein
LTNVSSVNAHRFCFLQIVFSRRSWSLSSRGQIAAKSRSKIERFHRVPSTEMAKPSSGKWETLLGSSGGKTRPDYSV